MFKKILVLLSVFVLFFAFATEPQRANALVYSKAGTLTAKKLVKEVIQEAAVNQAANLAVMEAMEIADKYQAKAGYKIVCPSGAATCDKPVQVKTDLSETDKTAIRNQSEVELDKLISPNGKGFSRWQSFVDWFLPIWLVTFAFTAITYGIDGDFRALINEAAYNALVALGIITPLTETVPIEDSEPEKDASGNYTNSSGVTSLAKTMTKTIEGTVNTSQLLNVNNNWIPYENMVTVTDFTYTDTNWTDFNYSYSVNYTTDKTIGFTNTNITIGNNSYGSNAVGIVNVNGQTVINKTFGISETPYTVTSPEIISILQKRIISIRQRAPYKVGEHYYTDSLFETAEGDVIEAQVKQSVGQYRQYYQVKNGFATTNLPSTTVTTSVYTGITPTRNILVPTYEEVGVDPLADSSYISEDGKRIALAPPDAIPYKQESTGETVYRSPSPTGDGMEFTKPDGTIVPEEDVVPGDVPQSSPSPDGVPTVTPAPTPSNPAPEPVPLTPAPTPTGETPPPGAEDEPPLSEFPEGEKCLAKLQFPIFSPLKEQLSTSFPFSIPWDIERAAHAAFDGVGNEKPSFDLVIPIYGGENYTVKIATPEFMDKWKPFMDGVLLLTFDLLLMFGLYRFVKGAGS